MSTNSMLILRQIHKNKRYGVYISVLLYSQKIEYRMISDLSERFEKNKKSARINKNVSEHAIPQARRIALKKDSRQYEC
jgi:hypothetical protein